VVPGYSDTLPANFVIGISPAVGTQLAPGKVVKLTVSKGPFPLHVPGVVGKNVNEARQLLEAEGLVVGDIKYVDSDKPRDEVLKQTPADGAGATRGTVVALEVSNAPAGAPMPRLLDQQCPDAMRFLREQGFNPQLVDSPLGEFFGVVRDQLPRENEPVQPGQVVQIRCGL
jgi:eukaryotic-like serine/threonine-protein kinase